MISNLIISKIFQRSLIILSFILVVFLLIFYIIQVTEAAQAGFTVSSHQREVARLSQENKNLEIYYSQTNSLADLDSLLQDTNFVRVDKVHYVQVLEEIIAVK